MADDDIERLLREIASEETGSGVPGKAVQPSGGGRDVEPAEQRRSPRVKWAVIAGVGSGGVGFLIGSVLWMLPWVNGFSTGIGAAIGGVVTGLVSGPPGWLKH